MSVYIRPWEASDAERLRPLLWDYLRVQAKRGGEWVLGERNVDLLLGTGLRWATRGDPTLLARRDATIIGWTIWGEIPSPFEQRWRTCTVVGAYIVPSERHQGIATQLYARAEAMASAAGYARITSVVLATNTTGPSACLNRGYQTTATVYDRMITAAR